MSKRAAAVLAVLGLLGLAVAFLPDATGPGPADLVVALVHAPAHDPRALSPA